jgi:hypothetical protein
MTYPGLTFRFAIRFSKLVTKPPLSFASCSATQSGSWHGSKLSGNGSGGYE